jgi:hypothetical protein
MGFVFPSPAFMSYAELSTKTGVARLKQHNPDLIVCDEAHKLARPKSARTRRLFRWFRDNPTTKFVALSGTMTTRSLLEFAHLCAWALKDGAPVPLNWLQLRSWSACVDVRGIPTSQDYAMLAPLRVAYGLCSTREAFARRLGETPGVVMHSGKDVAASLRIGKIRLELPPVVREALDKLEQFWESPDGKTLLDSALGIAGYRAQISQGFFYRWEWRNNQPDFPWLEARRAWAQACAHLRGEIDTPGLLLDACRAGCVPPYAAEAWELWRGQHHKRPPPKRAIWLSDFLLRDVDRRLELAKKPTIVWAQHKAVLTALGLPVVDDAMRGSMHCYASIRRHGTGRKLEAFSRSIVLHPPSNGGAWEQLLGRTHREGQASHTVDWQIYQHTDFFRGALASAKRDARYIATAQQQPQRLLFADHYKVRP